MTLKFDVRNFLSNDIIIHSDIFEHRVPDNGNINVSVQSRARSAGLLVGLCWLVLDLVSFVPNLMQMNETLALF